MWPSSVRRAVGIDPELGEGREDRLPVHQRPVGNGGGETGLPPHAPTRGQSQGDRGGSSSSGSEHHGALRQD
jgi:hypothetical protein